MVSNSKTVFVISLMMICIQVVGQDSVYAAKMDVMFFKPCDKQISKTVTEKFGKTKFLYCFYKKDRKIRTIIAWHTTEKPSICRFFYLNDSIVVISPLGQQPYYISHNKLVYGKEMLHNAEEIDSMITRANKYLLQAYRKIYRN